MLQILLATFGAAACPNACLTMQMYAFCGPCLSSVCDCIGLCIPAQHFLNDATCSSIMSLCMFPAEDAQENLSGTDAQIGLSDVELTAITMLEKEVGL